MSDDPKFERIFNFRDYGGYPAAGGRLATGRLFRSGHHHGATPADLGLFGARRVETVIDLRGDSERESHPCARDEGFAADVVFAAGETNGRAAGEPSADAADEAAIQARMIAVYRALPFTEALIGTYRLYFDALIERAGASMVHCFAGKDRTGIAVALVHVLTGVHDDDMMADYLASNDPELIERRVALEAATMRAMYGESSDAALRRMFAVDARWLEAAFDAMRARHGSVTGYAEAVLGMTPDRREALRATVVV